MKFVMISFVGFLTVSSSVFGGEDYRCVIERVSSAAGDSGNDYEFARKMYIGKEFVVDRSTGLMVGTLRNSYMTSPVVIDYGSKGNSFKVVTTMRLEEGVGAGSNVHVLVVNEYIEASKKPFVYLNNSDTYFGYCVHF